jgi:uncharacterized membrane protein YheB (UPF0754 family)
MNFLDNWQGLVLLAAFPLIGAAIGWLTNRLAIQMLFRPRQPARLLGMRFQGLIPRRQSELAVRVGEIVETELFNQHLIRDEIRKMDLKPYLEQLADSIVHQRIGPKLRQIPLLGNMVNERFLSGLKALAFDSLSRETEPLLERVSMEVEKHIAVRKIVEQRIHAFDLDQLEAIVRRLAREEFQRIELLGAVIGFAIGLVQVALLVLAQAL